MGLSLFTARRIILGTVLVSSFIVLGLSIWLKDSEGGEFKDLAAGIALSASALTLFILILSFYFEHFQTARYLFIAGTEIGWTLPVWSLWLVSGIMTVINLPLRVCKGKSGYCDSSDPNIGVPIFLLSFINAGLVGGWFIALIVYAVRNGAKAPTRPTPSYLVPKEENIEV